MTPARIARLQAEIAVLETAKEMIDGEIWWRREALYLGESG